MVEQDPQGAMQRQWRMMLIALIAVVVIGLGVAGYFIFVQSAPPPPPPAPPPPKQEAAKPLSKAEKEAMLKQAAELMCKAALAGVKDHALLPDFTKLSQPMPLQTTKPGRYVCVMQTEVAHYLVAVDLVCPQIDSEQCVSLYAVTADDKSVLYLRHDAPAAAPPKPAAP